MYNKVVPTEYFNSWLLKIQSLGGGIVPIPFPPLNHVPDLEVLDSDFW